MGRKLMQARDCKGLYKSQCESDGEGKLAQQLFKRDNRQQVGLARCGGSGGGRSQ